MSTSTRLSSHRSWMLTQLIIGLLIGALTLSWAVHGLDLRLVILSLVSARYAWVLVSLLCVIGVALAKTARWGALYSVSTRSSSFATLFSTLVASQMINVVVPIRLGELARIGLMKQSGQPGAATLSTIAVEKAVDLVAAGLIAVSLAVLTVVPTWLQEWSYSTLLVGLMLVVGLVLMWRSRSWLLKVIAHLFALGGWLPRTWQERLLRVIHTTLDAFGALTDLRSLVPVLFWTTVAWLLSVVTMLTLFAAFGLDLSVSAAAVLVLAVGFSSIVPSPPALVGVMHAIAVVVLGEYGVAQPVALGFGIVMNVVTVLPLIVLGSLALWQRTASLLLLLRTYSLREVWSKL